jgi:hypothetical protein
VFLAHGQLALFLMELLLGGAERVGDVVDFGT